MYQPVTPSACRNRINLRASRFLSPNAPSLLRPFILSGVEVQHWARFPQRKPKKEGAYFAPSHFK